MPEAFEIRGEQDLLRAIEMVEDGSWPVEQIPLFVDWPRYEIAIDGEDFDGGIPTRVIPALIEVQRSMRRAYSRSVHGSPRRRLSRVETRQTQLIIRLEPGSTKFLVALANLLNVALQRMNGPQRVATILAVAAMLSGTVVQVAEISAEVEKQEIEERIERGAQETRTLEIFAGFVERYVKRDELESDRSRVEKEWRKCLDDTDRLFINGEEVRTGVEGSRRALLGAEPERIVSVFRILSVNSGGVGPGFRIRVLNVETGERFWVSVIDSELFPEELETLKQGEWEKAQLQMEILADRRGGRIRGMLLSVEPAPVVQC